MLRNYLPMSLGDFLRAAERQGCSARKLRSDLQTISRQGNTLIIFGAQSEHSQVDGETIHAALQLLGLTGFERRVESHPDWEPSEDEQT